MSVHFKTNGYKKKALARRLPTVRVYPPPLPLPSPPPLGEVEDVTLVLLGRLTVTAGAWLRGALGRRFGS